MQDAAENCALKSGAAAVAPVDEIVVVPDVTASIVVVPAPICTTLMTVPIGKATFAFVGIRKSFAVATDIVTSLDASLRTAVYVAVCAFVARLTTGLVSVLFVSVSVVALPTSVSVEVGSVKVPVLLIVEMTGLVSVLLVSVSVVARPTIVSVDVGRVKVPVLVIEEMTGLVRVLLVSVWVPVKVATVESIATVGIGPVLLVILIPVPAVRAVISPVAPTQPDPS